MPASPPKLAVEKDFQRRSRFAQTLNVPSTVRLGLSLAAALLEGRFERTRDIRMKSSKKTAAVLAYEKVVYLLWLSCEYQRRRKAQVDITSSEKAGT